MSLSLQTLVVFFTLWQTVFSECLGTVSGAASDVLPPPAELELDALNGLAVDVWGNVYFADRTRVYRTSSLENRVSTVAGNGSATNSVLSVDDDDLPVAAIETFIYSPSGLFVDSGGNLFTSEEMGGGIRRVDFTDGTIELFAGNPSGGVLSDNVPRRQARVAAPKGITGHSNGEIYFVDSFGKRGGALVRKITTDGMVSSIAGDKDSLGYNGDNIAATSALLNNPFGVALNAQNGGIYITDTDNHRVRRVLGGTITTIAGNGVSGFSGDGAAATLAELSYPTGIAMDGSGNVYIADSHNHRIRRVNSGTGVITTVIGTGAVTFNGNGLAGAATNIITPSELALLPDGRLIFIEKDALRVRVWDPVNDRVSALAGKPRTAVSTAYSTRLTLPTDIAFSPTDDVYVIEGNMGRIRKIEASTGIITTIIGGNTSSVQNQPVTPIESAQLCMPAGVVEAQNGDLYFTETCNHVVRYIPAGSSSVHVVAGLLGVAGFNGESVIADSSLLSSPKGIAADSQGVIYFVDADNRRVRALQAGNVTTVVGTGDPYTSDGPALSSGLTQPASIAFDSMDTMYIGDHSGMIFAVTYGQLSRFAGNTDRYTAQYGNNIPALIAAILPVSITTGPRQSIYFIDGYTNSIRTVASGSVSTVVGGSQMFATITEDGSGAAAAYFSSPQGVRSDRFGNVYIADTYNDRVRILVRDTRVACPVGHKCECGKPLPCTNSSTYCPGMRTSAITASAGYYTLPHSTQSSLFVRQAPCPAGYFCEQGILRSCPAGRFGTAAVQTSVSACAVCPLGRYSSEQATVASNTAQACRTCQAGTYAPSLGSGFCIPCPPGTFAAAGENAACTPCPAGSASLAGASSCEAIPGLHSKVDALFSAEHEESPPATGTGTQKLLLLQALIAGPIVAGLALPLIFYFLTLSCSPTNRFRRCLDATLCKFDKFDLNHHVPHGHSPVCEKTALGGGMTIAALGVIVAIAAALIVQYVVSNGLLQQSIIPAQLPVFQELKHLPPFSSKVNLQSLPALRKGLTVQVLATGIGCHDVHIIQDPQLIGGVFESSLTTTGQLNQFVHTFNCPDCVFGPLSSLNLDVNSSCQAVSVSVGAVNLHGGLSVNSFAAAAQQFDGNRQYISSVTVAYNPTLSVFKDRIRAESARGVALQVEQPQIERSASANPTNWRMSLLFFASAQYVSVEIAPIMTFSQLLSNIIGLFGLFGGFAMAFSHVERLIFKRQHNQSRRQSGAYIHPMGIPVKEAAPPKAMLYDAPGQAQPAPRLSLPPSHLPPTTSTATASGVDVEPSADTDAAVVTQEEVVANA